MARAPVHIFAFSGAALVAGAALGWCISPRLRASQAANVRERGLARHANINDPDAGQREALRLQISMMEQEQARQAAQPVADPDRLNGLLARIPELRAAGDQEGLLALMQELASLGEPGYPAALEIAGILGVGKDSPLGIGPGHSGFRLVFTPAMVDLAEWALRHPKGVAGSFLEKALAALYACGERDVAGPLLAYLSSGEVIDPGLDVCDRLEGIALPSMAPAIAAAIRGQAQNGRLTWSLCGVLARLGSAGALRELEVLAASHDPAVADDARYALNAVRPAAGREGVAAVGEERSDWPSVLQWGDVVVSFGGRTVTSFDQLAALYKEAPQRVPQILAVERRGRLRFYTVTIEGTVTLTSWDWEDE